MNSGWKVMGILNATPDSFYDGGVYGGNLSASIDRAAQMILSGASILDIGGESTRPGAVPVSVQEEIDRVIPLITAVKSRFDCTISVDTFKSQTAREAVNAGAHWVNDVTAGRGDSQMAALCAELGVTAVLMHSRNDPQTMQENPYYENTVGEVCRELSESVNLFLSSGISAQSVIVDPGIGFAKSVSDNLLLLRSCGELLKLGFPLLIGVSRKSVIGAVTGKSADQRLPGSLAVVGETYRQGASIFRVHDVAETVDFLKMIDAVNGRGA